MKTKKSAILIVEDEAPIRDMIKFALKETGFEVIEADSASKASQILANRFPKLILLDWMLPGKSGIEFAKQLKKQQLTKDIPIIMLTARAEEESKLKGLELADDYITKPFSPKELLARIKTVLRRGLLTSTEGVIKTNGLSLDINTHEVTYKNQSIKLTPIEYKILHFFMTHPDRVYSREELITYIWGRNIFIDDRTVDVQIRRLRQALNQYKCGNLLKTIRGSGYLFSRKEIET